MDEAKEPREVTSAREWKSASRAKPIEVPSGNIAMVERRPLAALWKAGRIPNSLMPMVRKSIATGDSGARETDWTDAMLSDMIKLMDSITVECTKDPVVQAVPVCKSCRRSKDDVIHEEHDYDGEERSEDVLYVDDVDFDDKAFIYQYVIGAVDDVAAFRRGSERDVEPVPDSDEVERAPIDTPAVATGG